MTERNSINVFGLDMCRNQGLFWEPGILQFFLNMLFFLEAFVLKRKKILLLVTAFAVLTTYSTTGLSLLLLQVFVYGFYEFKSNKILIPIILILIYPVYIITSINLGEKIQGEKEASFQKRLFDLTQPLFIAFEHPLTGIGLDQDQFMNMRQKFYFSSPKFTNLQQKTGINLTVTDTDKGSSNSITFLLAATGFPTACFLLYLFFKQQIITNKKWLWMIIMFVSVMAEPLFLRPFFFIFVFSGFAHIFLRIENKKRHII